MLRPRNDRATVGPVAARSAWNAGFTFVVFAYSAPYRPSSNPDEWVVITSGTRAPDASITGSFQASPSVWIAAAVDFARSGRSSTAHRAIRHSPCSTYGARLRICGNVAGSVGVHSPPPANVQSATRNSTP